MRLTLIKSVCVFFTVILINACILSSDYPDEARVNPGSGPGKDGTLKTPTGLRAISLKPENQVKLVWDSVLGANSYLVEIQGTYGSLNSGLNWELTETNYFVDTQTYSEAGGQAKYRVKAANNNTESDWSAQVTGIRNSYAGSYIVGDDAPGGGFIVYKKSAPSDGWQYLEAAPVSSEKTAAWGLNNTGYSVSTSDVLGSGFENTFVIIDSLNSHGETGKAAQVCYSCNINGCDDWYLPNRSEFNEMLNMKSKLSLNAKRYWTSATSGGNLTHFYNTDDIEWYVTSFSSDKIQRSNELAVRPMRRF